jgi:hypothetical protein
VNCPPLLISLSFWVELVGACNSILPLAMVKVGYLLRALWVSVLSCVIRKKKTHPNTPLPFFLLILCKFSPIVYIEHVTILNLLV